MTGAESSRWPNVLLTSRHGDFCEFALFTDLHEREVISGPRIHAGLSTVHLALLLPLPTIMPQVALHDVLASTRLTWRVQVKFTFLGRGPQRLLIGVHSVGGESSCFVMSV